MKQVTITWYATEVSNQQILAAAAFGTVMGTIGQDCAKANMHDGTELQFFFQDDHQWPILEEDHIGDDGSPTFALVLQMDAEKIPALREHLNLNAHNQSDLVS